MFGRSRPADTSSGVDVTPRPDISRARADPQPHGYRHGMATGTPLRTLPVTIPERGGREERERLRSRARRVTELGLAWHMLEAAIAIAAGVIAGSVALVGFGADSVIEAGAGLVVLWLVTGERLSHPRRATCAAANRRIVPDALGLRHDRVRP